MRPGLVAVGVGFLVLAGGAVTAVNVLPSPPTAEQDQFTLAPTTVPVHSTAFTLIRGTSTGSGTLNVSWRAGGPVHLTLFPGSECGPTPGSCAASAEIAIWSGEGSAGWTIAGPLVFPYELVWSSNSSTTTNLSVDALESWTSSSATPVWEVVLIDVVAGSLGAVGAVALFLGLFLRGGVYGARPPLVSRSADDVHDLDPERPS